MTPKEVETFYKNIPKDSIPYFSSEVEISEIIYKPKPNPSEVKNAKDKLEKILSRIISVEDFEKLAKLYSDDLGSAKTGGNLGWMKRGSLVPEFEAAAFNLEKTASPGSSNQNMAITSFNYSVDVVIISIPDIFW